MAGTNYFNSDRTGYSGSMGSGSWKDFYSGIAKSGSSTKRPTAAQMQAIRDVPSNYSTADRLPGGENQRTIRLPTGEYVLAYNGVPKPSPAVAAIDAAAPNTGPGPLRRPGYAPTVLDMAAINAQPTFPVDSAIPTPANPAVAAALTNRITVRGGNPAVVAPKPKIAANALIDGQRGKDNMPGANYGGRSVGSDGVVRGYNEATRRWDNLSANSKASPSQSYKKDSLGDRDMRQTRKPGPGR